MVLIGEGVQFQMFYPLNEFIPIIKGSFLILTKCWPDLSRRYIVGNMPFKAKILAAALIKIKMILWFLVFDVDGLCREEMHTHQKLSTRVLGRHSDIVLPSPNLNVT